MLQALGNNFNKFGVIITREFFKLDHTLKKMDKKWPSLRERERERERDKNIFMRSTPRGQSYKDNQE